MPPQNRSCANRVVCGAAPHLLPAICRMTFTVIIPARLASTRLPNKPLADIAGKPMVVRVAERAALSGASQVVVATDHEDIAAACYRYGVEVRMTRADHPSGTDRIAEVAAAMQLPSEAVIVNVQGDEPLIDPQLVAATAALIRDGVPMATAAHPIADTADAGRAAGGSGVEIGRAGGSGLRCQSNPNDGLQRKRRDPRGSDCSSLHRFDSPSKVRVSRWRENGSRHPKKERGRSDSARGPTFNS